MISVSEEEALNRGHVFAETAVCRAVLWKGGYLKAINKWHLKPGNLLTVVVSAWLLHVSAHCVLITVDRSVEI